MIRPHDDQSTGAVRRPTQRVAAIDLGSNSFHMILAHLKNGVPHVVDRIRHQVQLGSGLQADGRLDEACIERGFEAIDLFAQRLGSREDLLVRVVGTNTLRTAKNARAFRLEAERRLGFPIEVISGDEEARLVYLGASHMLDPGEERRLVFDIGGGSTETIVGRGFEPETTHSARMGCISWSRRFFDDGKLSKKNFERAILEAKRELHSAVRALKDVEDCSVVGASGTIRATEEILRAGDDYPGFVSRGSLRALVDELIDIGRVENLALKGLKEDRAPIYAGGLAILVALFESFHVTKLRASAGALREGVIYDLIGRLVDADVRERSILDLERRFGMDGVQAGRVEGTAYAIRLAIAKSWSLDDAASSRYLRWASRLHEIGLSLAFDRFHRHGAYIVGNARMPGFSREDQERLAFLLLNQRRKLKLKDLEEFGPVWSERLLQLVAILRLSILLNRSRRPLDLSALHFEARAGELHVKMDDAWCQTHPLTSLDLEREVEFFDGAPIKVVLSTTR